MSWLGIDGEGIGRDPHRYVMMCASDSTGRVVDYIEDVSGLRTRDCFDWLLQLPTDWKLAGYYLTYDWTMILADLPDKKIYRLLRPELRARPKTEGAGFSHVRWEGYRLHYLSGMMRIGRADRVVTVWDVGKYFQSRFVVALEQSGIAPPALIRRMKLERGSETWTADALDLIRRYCLEECKYLARLVELLEEQHEAIGLKPRSWHGPGSTASALLSKHSVQTFLKKPPPEVELAAHYAYFGGRFEQSAIGPQPDVWAYDIRSAYPHAETTLPCLQHGEWVHATREPAMSEVAVIRYRVTDIGNRAWGPLPCRLGDGSIVWSRGEHVGWAWASEYWPARCNWAGVEFDGEAWVLQRHCDCVPFGFVPELYQWRVERPENKQVVKLASNSTYGKLAQTAGGGGPFSCRVWAGMITAACRGRMLQFIATSLDESKVYAVATDGVFSAEHRPDLASDELGGWEVSHKGAMVFLRPGIYWAITDVEADEREKALKAIKARGIGRNQLFDQIDAANQALRDGRARAQLGHSNLFGGARDCVRRTRTGEYRRSALYGQWFESPASLSLLPAPKRDEQWRPPRLDGVHSAPYNVKQISIEAQALRRIGSFLESRL